jgi:hypothetical protein
VLITRFEVVCVDDDPIAPLRQCFGVGVEPTILDDVCHAAIGFAKEEADSRIAPLIHALADPARIPHESETHAAGIT